MPTYSELRVTHERLATPDLLAMARRPLDLTAEARASLTEELFARKLYVTSEAPVAADTAGASERRWFDRWLSAVKIHFG